MKKFLLGIMMILCTCFCFAKSPEINYAAQQGVEIVNDSTLIYYETYKIVINQPDDVCTEIYKAPTWSENKKGIEPKLVMKQSGSYVFNSPCGDANYIVCASKPFQNAEFRQTESIQH